MSGGSVEDALAAVERLHAEVDAAAATLERVHASRLQCGRGCHSCCVDGLGVFEVEAERIRRAHPELLATGQPSAEGCAFLDSDGACRVYDVRPYRCRTQGLPLRWFDEGPSGEPVELRDICPLNEPPGSEPVTELAAESCWTLGPFESRLAQIQARVDGGRRVSLRDLFGG